MAAASSGAGLPEHAASVPAGSSSSGSGSRRGGATRAVLGVALTGVAVALAVVFGGGHAGGSAGKSKQAALPAFDTMADGAGASSPPLVRAGDAWVLLDCLRLVGMICICRGVARSTAAGPSPALDFDLWGRPTVQGSLPPRKAQPTNAVFIP